MMITSVTASCSKVKSEASCSICKAWSIPSETRIFKLLYFTTGVKLDHD